MFGRGVSRVLNFKFVTVFVDKYKKVEIHLFAQCVKKTKRLIVREIRKSNRIVERVIFNNNNNMFFSVSYVTS